MSRKVRQSHKKDRGVDPASYDEPQLEKKWHCVHCGLTFVYQHQRNDHVQSVHDPDGLAYSEFGPK